MVYARRMTAWLLEPQQTQEVHTITHYHYHRWPDFGVPESTEPIRQLCRILWRNRGDQQSVVVHDLQNVVMHCR
jgi:protein tyrosine phosphatase